MKENITSEPLLFQVPENATVTEAVDIQAVDFSWLMYRSSLSFNSAGAAFDNANLVLRIHKDSVIWFSTTHLGFEVARGMFDQDSVKVLNRFQKEYVVSDYNRLSNRLGIWLTFPRIQALLTGGLIYNPVQDQEWYYKSDSSAFFIGSDSIFKVNTEVLHDIRKPSQTLMSDSRSGNLLKVANNGFNKYGEVWLPTQSSIEMSPMNNLGNSQKGTSVLLKHQKIEAPSTAPGIPFSIPSNYKRITL